MIPTHLIPFIFPFSKAERGHFLEKLWYLLAWQAERYTMGDSTSIPVETAQELLASICFTLQFEMDISGFSIRDLLGMDFCAALKDGQAHLEKKTKEVHSLWSRMYALVEPLGNKRVMESLDLIEQFFKRYDFYFLAHQTPWDMGIPLLGPDAGAYKGIFYVETYLNRLQKLMLL